MCFIYNTYNRSRIQDLRGIEAWPSALRKLSNRHSDNPHPGLINPLR